MFLFGKDFLLSLAQHVGFTLPFQFQVVTEPPLSSELARSRLAVSSSAATHSSSKKRTFWMIWV